jgi:hypothetical protein
VASAGSHSQRIGASSRSKTAEIAADATRMAAVIRAERRWLPRIRQLMVLTGPREPLPAVMTMHFGLMRYAEYSAGRATSASAGAFPGVTPAVRSQWSLATGDATAVPNTVRGLNLWVVPGSTGVCFADTTLSYALPSGSCSPNEQVLAGKFVSVLKSPVGHPDGEVIMGLAPNGNATVKLTLADGTSNTVPVTENAYVAETSQQIRTVTLRNSAGTLTTVTVPGSLAPPS